MPMVSTIPAMPGSVRVAPIAPSTAKIIVTFSASATLAITPNQP